MEEEQETLRDPCLICKAKTKTSAPFSNTRSRMASRKSHSDQPHRDRGYIQTAMAILDMTCVWLD